MSSSNHHHLFHALKPHLDKEEEVCASVLYKEDGFSYLDDLKDGFSVDYYDEFEEKVMPQRMCSQRNDVWNIHTHPFNNYAYPSYTDIERVVNLNIPGSYVVTRWGVWIMSNPTRQVGKISKSQETRLKTILDDLGLSTRTKSLPKSRQYSSHVQRQISKFINKVSRMRLFLEISFIPWSEIKI